MDNSPSFFIKKYENRESAYFKCVKIYLKQLFAKGELNMSKEIQIFNKTKCRFRRNKKEPPQGDSRTTTVGS